MMKIEVDWTEAPEGTTHYVPDSDIYLEAWYKEVDGRWMFWLVDGDHGWYYTDSLPPTAIARPTEWNGTGLPPVGTKCEVHIYNNTWVKCTVVAHFENRAVVVMDNGEVAQIRDANHLRPIHTPEQIAAKKREKAISTMLEIFITGVERDTEQNTRSGIEALYNAGYRKTEQDQEQ